MALSLLIFTRQLDDLTQFYRSVFQLDTGSGDKNYQQLISDDLELILHVASEPWNEASTGARKDVAIKPIFFVESEFSELRQSFLEAGGYLQPAESEWRFKHYWVCDGHDPEGNIFQLRSPYHG